MASILLHMCWRGPAYFHHQGVQGYFYYPSVEQLPIPGVFPYCVVCKRARITLLPQRASHYLLSATAWKRVSRCDLWIIASFAVWLSESQHIISIKRRTISQLHSATQKLATMEKYPLSCTCARGLATFFANLLLHIILCYHNKWVDK